MSADPAAVPCHAPGRPEGAHGELMLRTFAFPADANPAGDIFGGWLLGQMDIVGNPTRKGRTEFALNGDGGQYRSFDRALLNAPFRQQFDNFARLIQLLVSLGER